MKHGPTSVGRYDRELQAGIHHWDLRSVMQTFSPKQIVSIGPSLCFSENDLAMAYADSQFFAVDIDREALRLSQDGRWPFSAWENSEHALSESNVRSQMQALICPENFTIENRTLVRRHPTPNLHHICGDMNALPFENDSTDLVLAFNALPCGIGDETVKPYFEIWRTLRNGGHLLNEWGLMRKEGNHMEEETHPSAKAGHLSHAVELLREMALSTRNAALPYIE